MYIIVIMLHYLYCDYVITATYYIQYVSNSYKYLLGRTSPGQHLLFTDGKWWNKLISHRQAFIKDSKIGK